MNFVRQTDGWSELSECGKYSVAIACVNGRFVNTAYYIECKPARILGVRKELEEARELCREHARKQSTASGAT